MLTPARALQQKRQGAKDVENWSKNVDADIQRLLVQRLQTLPETHIKSTLLQRALSMQNDAALWRGKWPGNLSKHKVYIEEVLKLAWNKYGLCDVKFENVGPHEYVVVGKWDTTGLEEDELEESNSAAPFACAAMNESEKLEEEEKEEGQYEAAEEEEGQYEEGQEEQQEENYEEEGEYECEEENEGDNGLEEAQEEGEGEACTDGHRNCTKDREEENEKANEHENETERESEATSQRQHSFDKYADLMSQGIELNRTYEFRPNEEEKYDETSDKRLVDVAGLRKFFFRLTN